MLGRKGCTAEAQTFHSRAMHAPRPPICPPSPQLRVGRPGRRLVPSTGGVRGGLVLGGGGTGRRD